MSLLETVNVLPVLFLVTVIAYNTSYIDLIMGTNGVFIILIIFFISQTVE